MESFLTIISAVIIFIISQYILEFILKPWRDFKNTIAKIDNKLKFYSNVIVNPISFDNISRGYIPEDYLLAKREIRELSCELETNYKNLLIFKPDKNKISEAVQDLIWISNFIGYLDYKNKELDFIEKAVDKIDNIRKNLNIESINKI